MLPHLERQGGGSHIQRGVVRTVDDFERTPAGKIKKFALRDKLRAEAKELAGLAAP